MKKSEFLSITAIFFLVLGILVFIQYPVNAQISSSINDRTNKNSVNCNCVIFRLDQVQDYYLHPALLAIMNLFQNKSQSLTLGLIANSIGNDTSIIEGILEGNKEGLFELSSHGWNFTDYSKLSEKFQETSLNKANEKIEKLFGQAPNVFIPPYGTFNHNTTLAMNKTGLRVLSSFIDNNINVYRLYPKRSNNNQYQNIIYYMPSMISYGDYVVNAAVTKDQIETFLSAIKTNIGKYGYTVINLGPEDFTNAQDMKNETVKKYQIHNLSILVDSLMSKGIAIRNFSEVLGIKTIKIENKKSISSSLSDNNLTLSKTMPENDTLIIHNKKTHYDKTELKVNDPMLKVERILHVDNITTGMAFLSDNDILLLNRKNGTVERIINGIIQPKPIIDLHVANVQERGLLGIAILKKTENKTEFMSGSSNRIFVYLFFTESGGGIDGDDVKPNNEPLGTRLYRYELVNNELIYPKLLLDLPATVGQEKTEKSHYGGKVLIGPDGNIYVGIGDVGKHAGPTENNASDGRVDGTGGILRVTYDGRSVQNSLLGNDTDFLKYYYAYGIRNTFGMDFDPTSGVLWDTENGPEFGDEINMVRPGFNSGWSKVQGMLNETYPYNKTDSPHYLVNFQGKGLYQDPEFMWVKPIGVTALKFLSSSKLGKQYQNSIFIGDSNLGFLYNFKVNPNRTSLFFEKENPLSDRIANNPSEMQTGGIIFGKGFGTITDIQEGPDGNLYVLNLFGDIFRISSASIS